MAQALRCAIYTRKSSEEGLDQSFNSLDAQREACEAFITSQQHEGWRLVKGRYDDGGFSGGSMERPGLERLLADIRAGTVQVIVVYKVDRLTRSLADFARMIAVFDEHDISFVSVTQQFNTTTSMGRLTLNVLLSFAQFEREVTGERIRDKIAASKRKGMWMGGYPPLGYDIKDRCLVVNESEAVTVRRIFTDYLRLGCVRRLKEKLDSADIVSKVRTDRNGLAAGGRPLSRGTLYNMLKNPLYIGRVAHKKQVYEGEHDAIVALDIWESVQSTLKSNREKTSNGTRAKCPSLLAGKLFDDRGNRMSPTHAAKSGKRYRYYVSQALIKGQHDRAGTMRRLPCIEIEQLVRSEVRGFLSSDLRVRDAMAEYCPEGTLVSVPLEPVLAKLDSDSALFRRLLKKVTVSRSEVTVEIARPELVELLRLNASSRSTIGSPTVAWTVRTGLKRSGGETKLILTAKSERAADLRPTLIKAVARGYTWNRELVCGISPSIRAVARKHGVDERQVRRHLPLALLAPDIIEAILEGRAPATLTVHQLYRKLPVDWREQRHVLAFSS